ncbi:MAG: hypothetical protein IKV50_05390, partial [Clostridia bacterium]|nr:hypothetical protein [Clostridia bacterium]
MKRRTVFSRCLLLLLTVVLLLGLVPGASAAKITKATKTYEIAVVFDNSGSMYAQTNGSAWCQAKYAMEIFASMIDYENGDKMTVFPMWEVVTDKNKIPKQTEADLAGQTPSSQANKNNAIKITKMGDLEKIHNLYTPVAGGTPIETVEDAYDYIKGSKADEKWLVILTDGKMQRKNPMDGLWYSLDESDVRTTLHGMASEDIKVQYIAFNRNPNNAYALESTENFYCLGKVIASAKELEQEVVNVCNRIFQRDVLTEGLSGNSLNLKISMSKLIVFAQGDA